MLDRLRRISYATWRLCLGLFILVGLFGLFIGHVRSLVALLLAIIVGGLALLAVLVLSLMRSPRGFQVRALFAAGLSGASLWLYHPVLRPAGERIFLAARRSALEDLAADLIDYDRIWHMSAGDRHFKELNGELVAYTTADVDTLRPQPLRNTYPVESILERDRIDHDRYQAFRTRLRRTGFIEVRIERDYFAFLYDGMFDNLYGFLWLRPDGQLPRLRTELFGTQLYSLRPYWGRWYYFATT